MELILKGRDYPAKGMKLIHDTLMADTIKIINPIMLLNEKSCPLADFVLRMVTFFRAISPLKVPCMRNSRLLTPFPAFRPPRPELLSFSWVSIVDVHTKRGGRQRNTPNLRINGINSISRTGREWSSNPKLLWKWYIKAPFLKSFLLKGNRYTLTRNGASRARITGLPGLHCKFDVWDVIVKPFN